MTSRIAGPSLQRLTREEIDRRIRRLGCDLLDGSEPVGDEATPRWIRAEELVRRMQPFLCRN